MPLVARLHRSTRVTEGKAKRLGVGCDAALLSYDRP